MKKFLNKQLIMKLMLSFLVLVLLSLVLTWLLEFRYYSDSAVDVANFISSRPQLFLFNAWLMFIILLFLASIFGSIFWAGGVGAATVIIIGYIHINKFASRGQPLLPEDFQLASQAASLSKFVSVDSIVRLVVAVLSVLVMAWVLEHWVGHFFISARIRKQREGNFLRRHLIIPRAASLLLSLVLFFFSTGFIIHHGNGRTRRVDFLNTTFIAWNQTYNYNDNGFIIGFLYNWSKFNLPEPEDYSESRIAEIKEKYREIAKASNENRLSLDSADYNIVIILNESFMDPDTLDSHYSHSGGDITPNLHALMDKYPSGYMFTIDYGGGTANIEFETVTGLTNYWADTVPYTSIVPHLSSLPSIASFAKEHGYSTTAIHAYNGGMYKRNIALPIEGFEEFIAEAEFTHAEHDGGSEYINDRSTYAETLAVLDRNEKNLVLAITMQNHTPYNSDNYEKLNFILDSAPSNDTDRKKRIETYFETLHSADAYLGEFISALENSEQKTVVLFYGDHAPGLFAELDSSEDAEEFALSRRTPYFIYANFDIENNENLPTTTPNCLVNTMLNTLNLQKTSFNYLVDDVCAVFPVLTPRYFGDKSPEDGKSSSENETLQSYELVNYDFLSGKTYWDKN